VWRSTYTTPCLFIEYWLVTRMLCLYSVLLRHRDAIFFTLSYIFV
jgi:hypothetical protein